MKTGIELIAQERAEQIEKHGHVYDDNYVNGELVKAAIASINKDLGAFPESWDKSPFPYKIVRKPYLERLVIAGALIAAEIDRLQHTS